MLIIPNTIKKASYMTDVIDIVFQSLYKDLIFYKGLDLLGLSFMLLGVYILPNNKIVGAILIMISSCIWFKFNLNINSYISMIRNTIIFLINFRTFIVSIINIHKQRCILNTNNISKKNYLSINT